MTATRKSTARRDSAHSPMPQPAARAATSSRAWLVVGAAAVMTFGVWTLWSSSSRGQSESALQNDVTNLRIDVLRQFPHDISAYTQGLLWYEGKLYESTGETGKSDLRRLDPTTGAVERLIDLDPSLFGEGLARVGRRLIQLTWKSEIAFVYDLDTFETEDDFSYVGEGWGLAFDGRRLIMSDGSARLTFRDPQTFDETGDLLVTLRGLAFRNLNELEWVDGSIYANVWQQDIIVRIDPRSGEISEVIDAAGLLSLSESRGTDVLNGIAYNPESQTFYITGKLWPKMFEVRFVS